MFSEDKLNQVKGTMSNWCLCVHVYIYIHVLLLQCDLGRQLQLDGIWAETKGSEGVSQVNMWRQNILDFEHRNEIIWLVFL